MGVCAGIADHFDIDVTLVRVAMVLALIMTFPLIGIAYLAVALVAKPGAPRIGYDGYDAPRLSAASVEATRERMRDIDARMQAIESYVTSSNTSLAREIDELR
jgi:phage shock protein C